MTIPTFPETRAALKGRKGLIVGIANDQSIAWGCAKAFRALGADVAVTYLNDKAKRFVEPLASELESPIFMPLDVMVPGQMEAVFEQITKQWGQLDFLVHSIAFSPRETLHGRVIDVGRDGFLATMDVSCWSFLHMAHLAEPLMKNGGTLFAMTYYGSECVVKNYNIMGVAKAALECAVRYSQPNSDQRESESMPSRRDRWRRVRPPAFPNSTNCWKRPLAKAPARSLVSIDDVGKSRSLSSRSTRAKLMTGQTRSTSMADITSSIESSLVRLRSAFADGLEKFGYRDSPLEEMAYRLDNQFQRGAAVFSVEQVVGRELKLLAGV